MANLEGTRRSVRERSTPPHHIVTIDEVCWIGIIARYESSSRCKMDRDHKQSDRNA